MEKTEKIQLQQIKIFWVNDSTDRNRLEQEVNDCCVNVFENHSNYPEIHCTSKYIAVIYNALREVAKKKNDGST